MISFFSGSSSNVNDVEDKNIFLSCKNGILVGMQLLRFLCLGWEPYFSSEHIEKWMSFALWVWVLDGSLGGSFSIDGGFFRPRSNLFFFKAVTVLLFILFRFSILWSGHGFVIFVWACLPPRLTGLCWLFLVFKRVLTCTMWLCSYYYLSRVFFGFLIVVYLVYFTTF